MERIRQGSYDLVLILRAFVFHKQTGPIVAAAKSAGVQWGALVDGYGAAAMRLGIERFLGE